MEHNDRQHHQEIPSQEAVDSMAQLISKVSDELSHVVIGQRELIHYMLLGLLSEGHILIEGLPGLAKTLAAKSMAKILGLSFNRIQFTPDLLPSDLIGTLIYKPNTHEFEAKKGPIFSHIILADEINRSPAKVQSALLEGMGEEQVTLGDTTYPLPNPFLVLATQNPIEQEGTYPLPEAQLDRFMFKVCVDYPSFEDEKKMIATLHSIKHPLSLLSPSFIGEMDILRARHLAATVHTEERLIEYILRLIAPTRPKREPSTQTTEPHDKALPSTFHSLFLYGASPRASLLLSRAAKAEALTQKRNFVLPEDVKTVFKPTLRHRVQLTFEALSEGHTIDALLDEILASVHVV